MNLVFQILLCLLPGGAIVYFGPRLALTILRDHHHFTSPLSFDPRIDAFAAGVLLTCCIVALIVTGLLIRYVTAGHSFAFYYASFLECVRTVLYFVLALAGIALTGVVLYYFYVFLHRSANR